MVSIRPEQSFLASNFKENGEKKKKDLPGSCYMLYYYCFPKAQYVCGQLLTADPVRLLCVCEENTYLNLL